MKSNAIVVAADGATVGVGMGQVNRVDVAKFAVSEGEIACAARSRPQMRSSRSRMDSRR